MVGYSLGAATGVPGRSKPGSTSKEIRMRSKMKVMIIEVDRVQGRGPGAQLAGRHSSGYEFLGGGVS